MEWETKQVRVLILFILISIFCLVSCSQQTPDIKPNSSGYIEVNQGKLFYQRFGSGGIPIVILHGGPGLDQTYLQPQLLTLAKNHTVIFYDQRGSGKSLTTAMNANKINLTQFTQDIEALRSQLKLDKIILLGHSWGGFLGMNYAIHYPEHVAGLILMNTLPADYKGQQAFEVEFGKRTKAFSKDIAPLFDPKIIQPLSGTEIAELYKKVFSVYFYNAQMLKQLNIEINPASAKSGAKVMQMISKSLAPKINLYPQLKKLTVPTLIIHGEEDIIPVWTAQQLEKTLPNANLIITKNCGHFAYIEGNKEAIAEIDGFINEVKS